MSYPLTRLQPDIAQVQHEVAGFGTGRLVAEDLVLTAAHVLWSSEADRMAGGVPTLDGWQVRLARDHDPGTLPSWPFRRGNRVVWHDPARDLALIRLVNPEGGPLRPELRLRIATVEGNNPHAVEARGYPRAAMEEGQRYRDLTPALGRVTAGDRHRPLRFGVDGCDLPNRPHADWPGMSGSAVLLQNWPDAQTIWVYGVVQEVPANFDGQLRVARLADVWQPASEFRELLIRAGVADEDAADPTAITLRDRERLRGPFAGVPVRVAGFTGRGAELDRLDAVLLGSRPAAVTQAAGPPAAGLGHAAVLGLGGVGKTSLAVEYAHHYRDFYAGVWWCPAQTRTGLLTSLAGLAVELGAVTADEAEIERAAQAGLKQLARQRTPFLLVYDNVVSPDAIAELLPASGARVLITSRFADWGSWAEEVALDVLPQAEAVAFLQKRAERQDEAGATLLAEILGRLPLALDHAAAYCRRIQMHFADYAARAKTLIATAPRGSSYPRSVAATFGLAMDEAVELCPAAEELMAYLAQCGPERVPLALVDGAVADEAERDTALLALTEVSLARRDPFEDGTPAVTVHRLVQAIARARAEAKGGATLAAERITGRLLEIYPHDSYEDPVCWPICAQLTPHVVALHEASFSGIEGVERAELLLRLALYLHGRAAYTRAEKLVRAALAIRERALGPEHPDTATNLNNLASLLQDQGNLAGARPLFERALTIRERALGPEHPNTATSLDNLASVLKNQGDLAGARPLFERALAIRERALGPEHPSTAMSLDHLAKLLQNQDNLARARPLFERALTIRERALGPEHPGTATSLNNLASLLRNQGDLAGARPLHERALAIRERALGPEHPDTATSLNNLAILLEAQGDLAGALPLFARALAISELTLGLDHFDTATSLNNLAGVLQYQGDLPGARPLFERALAIRERALGPEHPDTTSSLNNLASLLHDQGDLAGARPLYERVLTIRERALGPEHLDTTVSLNNLASLLHDQGDLAGARPLHERALAIRERALGPEHPNTATSLNNLASLLKTQGDLAGARPLFERALAIRERALGPEHPDTATSLSNLAGELEDQGDLVGARPLFERALTIRERALGPEHPGTARSLNNLASLLQDQGDLAGARQLYERTLAIRERALGPEHPDTATSLNNLAFLFQAQGDLAGARPLFERALAICERALGPEHPSTARSINNLASLLQAQGDLAGARPLFERALVIRELTLGPEHFDTATSLNNLAVLLQDQGNLSGARPLFERALAIRERALGPEHPDTATIRCNLTFLEMLEMNGIC